MTEEYKQFDSAKTDKIPIVPGLVKHISGLKFTELISIVIVFVVSLVCVVFVILYTKGKPAVVIEENVCVTAACLKSASYVAGNMNKSVDPCKNFYKYACGGFPNNNRLDAETYSKTVYTKLYYENEEKLKNILESPVVNGNEHSAERKLKDMFASCTNSYLKERAKGYPFLNKILPNTGGWYVLGTWNSSTWNMQNALEKVHMDYWTNALFTFRVATDWYDWKKRVVEIDYSGMSMYWWYYVHAEDEKYSQDLKKFMKTVGTLLVRDSNMTIENSTQKIETFVNDAYGMELKLANLTAYTYPTYDPHADEKRISLRDFTAQTGNVIDFTSMLTKMFREAGVNAYTKVVIMEDDWLRQMVDMVKNLGPDKNRMLNNYFTWRMAYRYVQQLSWEYVHANREFYVDRYGIPQFLGTWYYCFYNMDTNMGDALSSLYVKDHFADRNKQKVHEILDYIKKAMSDGIVQNVFMDRVTKDLAKEKIMTSLDKMGYPDFMMNDDQLTSIYQSLKVSRTDYFENELSLNKFKLKDWNNRLRVGEDRSRWVLHTYDTYMEYYGPWHELIVPAGLLQFPVYDYSLPHYINFGSMGSLLGHYLVHAIDRFGSIYDKNGDYNVQGWWSNKTKLSYNTTTNCFIDYFNNKTMGPFAVPGQFSLQAVPVNGRRYAREGMAIASGVKLAFRAYQKWMAANRIEKLAPGLGLSNEQMFFVSYAQSECFNRNDRIAYDRAIRGRVSEDIATNSAMSHVREFSQAFRCPVNSPMNPAKKCNLY
ncbi:endothelin-converting enzyme homolog [Mytilus californianus]|uniref:endothelin-converting enzyme homolog n=1 Tax=Mytilus californianus TaxID=6549 RepID=UPI0022456CF7|nr:endothelin-converting enzyme homolog [Mytilus californianus]